MVPHEYEWHMIDSVVMGDTQNFIHDKYREKISRYSIYRDIDLWPSTHIV